MNVIYKEIPEAVGYCCDSDGEIWSRRKPGRGVRFYDEWHRLHPTISSNGYLTVRLAGVGYRTVHRLILEAFVGSRPPGMQARHIDGDRFNNRSENLRWGTSRENAADQLRHGTFAVGSRNGRSKLVEGDIETIDQLRSGGVTYAAIAEMFGVDVDTVWSAHNGHTWKHAPRFVPRLTTV